MAKVYGSALKKSIQREKDILIEVMRNRDERIARWETDEDDCWRSIMSDQQGICDCNTKLSILETDGFIDWDCVFDENGEEVSVRWVNTKYGLALVGRGVFASSMKALCKKTGWHVETKKVPCWVGSNGIITRWHTNMVTGEYFGYPD